MNIPVQMLKSWIPEGYSLFECPVLHCKFSVLTLGGQYTNHPCPYEGGETKLSWSGYGPSLLEQTWADLDALYAEYAELKLTPTNDDETYNQQVILYKMEGRMRGIASVLARFMVPHFDTENSIVRETVKRWQKRKAGEEYETPGLLSRRYEPPPDDGKIKTVKITLSAIQQDMILAAPDTTTDAELAKMFQVNEVQIKTVRYKKR